ncbi:hypothetical protein KTO58_23015 [Chitinophaga pendula]|uniref:hypothetical protein n=1 Tax=Chitinophaga TaxID=79328 RepID=UPI000BAFA9FF|nr:MULTISPECIES: hypothetical protein [Chitinophaga]ASZ10514.1 hypothetical protein CK934_05755 [Chitinophaga sp. MD30]UCJ06513.1 hypothetical protein KTO58_23015 [Chitinophaga pendula]
MELKQYIESGIIEFYALGLASEEEQAELMRMRQLYPELGTEIAAVEARLQQMAFDEAVPPPERLRERALAGANWQDAKTGKRGNARSNYTFINIQPKKGDYISVHKWWKYLFIIVFVLSKVFLVAAIYFYLKYKQLEEERDAAQPVRTEAVQAHP